MSSSSTTSMVTTHHQPNFQTFQQRLQFIIQSCHERWAYAIFWLASRDAATTTTTTTGGSVVLTWSDGHYQGTKNLFASILPDHHNNGFANIDVGLDIGKRSRLGRITAQEIQPSADTYRNNPYSSEWDYYVASVGRSYSSSDGVLGGAFCSGAHLWLSERSGWFEFDKCGRLKEARLHGIKTMVCVPTSHGVVELGSSDLVEENTALVDLIKFSFNAEHCHLALNTRTVIPSSNPAPDHPVQLHSDFSNLLNSNSFLKMGAPNKVAKKELCYNESVLNKQFKEAVAALSDAGQSDDDDISRTSFMDSMSFGKKRGPKAAFRKRGGEKESILNPVEAERQRRQKLNQRFYALRSVVPKVSKMDKASLLADAVAYIKELKAEIEKLENKQKLNQQDGYTCNEIRATPFPSLNSTSPTMMSFNIRERGALSGRIEVSVRILGMEAIIRAHSSDVNYPSARLMSALRELEFEIYHASVSRVKEVVVQDVVIRVPNGWILSEEGLRNAILEKLQTIS